MNEHEIELKKLDQMLDQGEEKSFLVSKLDDEIAFIDHLANEDLSAKENDHQRDTAGSIPLVERSILFDFTTLSSLPTAQADSSADDQAKETHDKIENHESDEVLFDRIRQDDMAHAKEKSAFELEEHLKMLCDAELVEQIQAIPKRISFKIGEVADLVGVKSFVLRFWETEFDLLKPKKASNNQRMYSKKDVEVSFLIKKLLYRDRFSIEGARNVIKQARQQLKSEVSKIEEVSTSKQKMETLVRLQKEKIALLKNKSAPVKVIHSSESLAVRSICEDFDLISSQLNQLKKLFI